MRRLTILVALVLDVALLLSLAAMTTVLLGYGGWTTLFGWRVGIEWKNAALIAGVVAPLRVAISHIPFVGIGALRLDWLPTKAIHLVRRWSASRDELTPSAATRILIVACLLSALVKLSNIIWHFGFWTGDDVEIHEMTFASLFGWTLPVWDIRSPFYPFGFIFPIQYLVRQIGFDSPTALVAAGRGVGLVFSLLNIWLTFHAAKRFFGRVGPALLSALLLAANQLHTVGGSTELPRTVASFFVLSGFTLLTSPTGVRSACAGVLLAVAAAMRFSEVTFLVPAALVLLKQKRYLTTLCVLTSFVIVIAVLLGGFDQIYWGSPFYSLQHFADFTLVRRLSTRGYEPFWEYATSLLSWTNIFVACAAIAGVVVHRQYQLGLWFGCPALLMSVLPHKEVRYLIPILPFFSMLAGVSLWRLLSMLGTESTAARSPRIAAVVLVAVCGGMLAEAEGHRLERSENEVRIAQFVVQSDSTPFAASSMWRFGGRLYFGVERQLIDVDAQIADPLTLLQTLQGFPNMWLALPVKESGQPEYIRALSDAGFRSVVVPNTHTRYQLFRKTSSVEARKVLDSVAPDIRGHQETAGAGATSSGRGRANGSRALRSHGKTVG